MAAVCIMVVCSECHEAFPMAEVTNKIIKTLLTTVVWL